MSESWMRQAGCLDEDPELFFPGQGSAVPIEALMICSACPVQQECRDYAKSHGEKGVWGGTSERQRQNRSEHDASTCRNGHARSIENTVILPNGRRRCRECLAASDARSAARKRAARAAARETADVS